MSFYFYEDFLADGADVADWLLVSALSAKSALSARNHFFMTENEISYIVRGAIFEIYNHFGPGLFESVYKEAIYIYLLKNNLSVQKEVGIAASYSTINLGLAYRMDILVENKVILEIKSVDAIIPIFEAQLITYLKLADKRLGYLINFNVNLLKDGFKRVVYKFE